MIFGLIAATAAATATAPGDGARQQATVIMSENAGQRRFQEEWGYADAVSSNGVVYLSGVPVYLDTGEKDMEVAFNRAFVSMGKTLTRAGVTWDDVVEVRSVHTDVNGQIAAMVKVKNRYMTGKAPACTAVGTNGLLQPGGIAEITLVAHVPTKRVP